MPNGPGRALDVGSGTGTDAAWLAAIGYHVVAVEPVLAFREAAARLHTSASIEWLDDALPELPRVAARGTRFNLVMLTAVWMHLNTAERARAFTALRALLAPGALLFISVRNGPVPYGRRMFSVPPEDVLGQAHCHGLSTLFHATTESSQPLNIAAGVTWERYVFQAQRGDA
jgi:SAM-dependent methyltransferase